jgi:hypothetical protein
MKVKGSITLLVNQEGTTITIRDKESSLNLCEVTLTPQQLSAALSRLAHTPCELEIFEKSFEHVGKKLETDRLEFEIPVGFIRANKELVNKLALEATPEGWVPDLYFNSQNSFFTRDGKNYAMCVVRRWV